MRQALGCGVAALVLLAGAARAQEVPVRLGTHSGFGRVVLDAPEVRFTTERLGDVVVLHMPLAGHVASAAGTRNVLAVQGGLDEARLTVAPGARLRIRRLGERLVVDVLDPLRAAPKREALHGPANRALPVPDASPAATPPQAAPEPVAGQSHAALAAPVEEKSAAATGAVPSPAPPAAAVETATLPKLTPAPVQGVVRQPGPSVEIPATSAAAGPVALAAALAPEGAMLPFAPGTAAAAFRRRGEGWAVFDERRPLDLAALADAPALQGATVTLLPEGTLVRVPLPPGKRLRLSRQPGGWLLGVTDAPWQGPVLAPRLQDQALLVATASPGAVVAVPDAATGQNLLVGTLRANVASGVPVAYRVPAFSMLASWEGLAVEPLADRTALRAVKDGFTLEAGVPLSSPPPAGRALEAAAALTRRFDLSDESATALMQRLRSQVVDEAMAPAQAKRAPRIAAAQTMLALGMGPEAEALLGLALADDPRAANDPLLTGLRAAAALVSGRPGEADGLLSPALDGTDEAALWRAVRLAMLQPGSMEAVPVFAAEAGLLLAYPAGLRERLLPLAAETMARGGAGSAADALLAKLKNDPALDYARAMRLAAKGDTAGALAMYGRLAAGRDRLVSARAATAAALLRLATQQAGPADTAAMLERNFLSWRGDGRERDLRLRAAALRADAGQWRLAIDGLHEEQALYPDDAILVRDRVAEVLKRMLTKGGESVPPLELVALADENAEALTQADPAAAARLMAEKLAALDLPDRAGPVLEKMMFAAPPGADRARLGARLAGMRLEEADDAGADAALEASEAPGLPAPLAEQRGLLRARVLAAQHDVAGAAAVLSALDSAAADDLRATVLGAAGDWTGADAALASLVARTVPDQGPLDGEQQDVLVRLASAQSRAGDDAGLRALGAKQAARVTDKRGEVFRLLTASPVTGVGDLHRAEGEVALARAVPGGIAALGR